MPLKSIKGIITYKRPQPAIAHNHLGKRGAFIDDNAAPGIPPGATASAGGLICCAGGSWHAELS